MKKPDLTPRRVSLATLVEDPHNARIHDTVNIQAIRDLVKRYGQVEPLVVQKGTLRIIAGHGRKIAMLAEGLTEVDVIELDVTDQEAAALGLGLNRSAELADWSFPELQGVFRSLQAEDFDINSLGWAPFELEPLLQGEWRPKPTNDGAGSDGGSTIHLTTEQKAVIEKAADRVRALRNDPDMKLGTCLVEICEAYLK